MQTQITSAVTQLLIQHAYDFQVIEIPLSEDKKPIRSLEELLTAQGLQPQAVVRSVVFKGENSGFSLLAVAGGRWRPCRLGLVAPASRRAQMPYG
jgi:hypothetical protein